MTGTIIYKKNKDMVTRKIADETILLPIYRTSKEINCIYTLNKPASIVWDMIDGKTTVGEIKQLILNNGFDLIKDSVCRIKDKVERGKDEGLRIKDKVERGGSRERERERGIQRDTQHASRDARKEVDSQLKVFFKELREIKAVIRDTRSSMIDTRKKKKDGKGALNSVKRVTRKGRKMKFRPEITRVKLNPEQAVLSCGCYVNLLSPEMTTGNREIPQWTSVNELREVPQSDWVRMYVCSGAGSKSYKTCRLGEPCTIWSGLDETYS